jgi:hypothetical protein
MVAAAQRIELISSLASMTTTNQPIPDLLGIDPAASLCATDKNRNGFPVHVFYLQARVCTWRL